MTAINAQNGAPVPEVPRMSLAATEAVSVLPSVLQLGLLIKALDDRAEVFDDAASAAKKGKTPECLHGVHAAESGHTLALDRSEALKDLVLTLPARSLGDAAVQLYMAFNELDRVSDFQLDMKELEAMATRLRRLVAGVLPVVAGAAGLTVEQIGGDYMAARIAREHPAVEA